MVSLIDHVSERTKFISNSRRESISVGQYLREHDASSAAAFVDYSSNLLRSKLSTSLGQGLTVGKSVDWDLNGVRTSPVDHKIPADSARLLKEIADGKEKLN